MLRHVEPYILTARDVRPVRGALTALSRIAAAGIRLAVVTNQSPIGRGLVTAGFVAAVNRSVSAALARRTGRDVPCYTCPHRPGDGCACRKPAPGLLLRAAADAGVPIGRTWFVGDHDSDMAAAAAAGCGVAVHVRSGRQTTPSARADVVVDDLAALARLLLNLSDPNQKGT